MKKQQIKKFLNRKKIYIFASFFMFSSVYATFTLFLITPQTSTQVWSNNSIISFTWVTDKQWYYVNDENNSTIIKNYFKGYYYDNLYWYFKLDWSNDKTKNVKIIWSTDKCNTWYWYKLWWKAYNEFVWYIDFDYDLNNFVYFCSIDWKLHWKAYSKIIWFQNFEWIDIQIVVEVESLFEKITNYIFNNDTTEIEQNTYNINNEQNLNTFWWDLIQTETVKESIFYIIK